MPTDSIHVLAGLRFVTEPFEPAYMRRALIAMLLLALLAGVVGVVVQLRRLAFMTDAMTHTVFPGVAIAFFMGDSLFVGALIAAGASAVLLTLLARHPRIDEDALVAFVLATFFSVGVIVVSRNRTFTADLNQLLFGRVLTISTRDVVEIAVVCVASFVSLYALRKELWLRSFDPVGAAALGYPTVAIDMALNLLIALVVVAAVRAVGTALVVALLTTPAATARIVTSRITTMMVLSCVIGAVGGWLGLVISYDASIHHDVRLAAGATTVVVLTVLFAAVALAFALVRRRGARQAVVS
ncbi:MAG: metal ABC transporter permease [Acidimicrobiales bacterium]